MKLLLDTHVFLWWLDDPGVLTDAARIAIANPANFVFVSAASVLEISIKQAHGKLTTSSPPEDMLPECRFHELPISIGHAVGLRALPPIHKDPFDRILVAQARAERFTLVTRDPVIAQYDVTTLAA